MLAQGQANNRAGCAPNTRYLHRQFIITLAGKTIEVCLGQATAFLSLESLHTLFAPTRGRSWSHLPAAALDYALLEEWKMPGMDNSERRVEPPRAF